jgi:hypothetical protein
LSLDGPRVSCFILSVKLFTNTKTWKTGGIWKRRFREIDNFERYLAGNGSSPR